MGVTSDTIIPATTSLAYSQPFNVVGSRSITAGPISTDEAVRIEYSYNGSDFEPLYLNGVLQEIDVKHSLITIYGPGKFRCLKTATASPCGVYAWDSEAI